jgi:urease accessory protein
MLRTLRIERAGHWLPDKARGVATLTFDDRHRRRVQLSSDAGEPFLLDLQRPVVLEDGDGIALSDGTWFAVKAAPETLLEVTAADAAALTRLAWHLGNRHLPAQIEAERILIRDDHVIAAMIEGLGGHVRRIDAPFTPERGAYETANPGHDHHHDHEHH